MAQGNASRPAVGLAFSLRGPATRLPSRAATQSSALKEGLHLDENGMGDSRWWRLPMIVMMVVFWGGLIWIGVTLLTRIHTQQLGARTAPAAASSSKPTAQEILAERLARGEIEPDEYRQRLEALLTPPRA
jgi:putative membrane protein